MKKLLFILTFSFSLALWAQQAQKYEMRAGWIASVNNIDWPGKPGDSVEEQKTRYIAYLDSLQSVRANAVVMQIRPTADAFYAMGTEPWSRWLMGKQGEAPAYFYDPVAFMIEETHKRGMEFHAWLNPYRLSQDADTTQFASGHPFWKDREIFVEYGKKWYYDPGQPKSRKYTNDVVKEIVSRYDVDAIHFDDYFYPYKVSVKDTIASKTSDGRDTLITKSRVVDFPDSLSYEKYGKPYFKNKDDWRRNNVDLLIRELNETIKSTKPWVKFGISPFGVWRNISKDPVRGSQSSAGVANYDDLYADIILWSEKGWIDYVVPQLYWKIGFKVVDYPVMLDWWIKYSYGKHLYIGHSMWNGPEEITKQIEMLRGKGLDNVQGSVYWSSGVIHKNGADKEGKNSNNMNGAMRRLNPAIAIVPPMPWIDDTPPPAPSNLRVNGTSHLVKLTWDAAYSDDLAYFLVYKFNREEAVDLNNPYKIIEKVRYNETKQQVYFDENVSKGEYVYVVTALDRNNNESKQSASAAVKLTPGGIK